MESSALGRLISVLVSPSKAFEALRERPTWLLALLVLIILGVVGTALVSGKIDYPQMIQDSIEAQGRDVPEAQMEGIIDFYEKFGPVMSIAGSFVPIIGYLLIALVFLVVLKMFGGSLTFGQSFATTLHAMMPQAVKGILSIPVILGKSEFSFLELRSGSILKSNVGAFAPEETGPVMLALLSSLDIFTIWTVALMVIGFAIVARVSKGTAAVAGISLWLLWILIKTGLATLGGIGG